MDDVERINGRLLELYNAWIMECFTDDVKSELTSNQYNHPQLVKCFDRSYFDKRIMVYGKEAHDICPWKFNKDFAEEKDFKTDELWGYDVDILSGKAKNTFYLKTRKIICQYHEGDVYDKRRSELFSVLTNNLNKTAPKGAYEPCDGIANNLGIYKDFEFEGYVANVFIHELRILEPKKIILLCGKGYDLHIKRAFGDDFASAMKEAQAECDFFIKKELGYSFEVDKYKVLHCFHPSTRLRKTKRVEYNTMLEQFV